MELPSKSQIEDSRMEGGERIDEVGQIEWPIIEKVGVEDSCIFNLFIWRISCTEVVMLDWTICKGEG